MDITIQQFVKVHKIFCSRKHCSPCDCNTLLNIAKNIIENGICVQSEVFKNAYPNVKYTAEVGRRKLLQMPLVSMVVGEANSGTSQSFLMEAQQGVNYEAIQQLLTSHLSQAKSQSSLTKEALRNILSLAKSSREKELVRYTAFVAGNFSQTSARKTLGLEEMNRRASEVERCIAEAKTIREAIEQIVEDEVHSICLSDSDSDCESDYAEKREAVPLTQEAKDYFIETLRKSDYNWFELLSQVESCPFLNYESLLETFFRNRTECEFTPNELNLVEQSFFAYKSDEEQYAYDRKLVERLVNGEVVTDSESDNPDLYNSKNKALAIRKKIEALRRSAKRRYAKRIADKKYLQHKYSRKVQTITEKYPDIGTTIEQYVQDCNVGADAWRRTGVLTFDGNIKVQKKATYSRIQQHLDSRYGRTFSYGTVVELCIARNKRRKSSARYKGLAKVTSRRARKGFSLRYNPDAHWSGSFYRGLNDFQFTDGRNILNINRDDASGFRLDTLSTNKQYHSLSVSGKDVLTTRTDYVNKYKSVLQTASYNFTATRTTGEICAGVVKAHALYPKNPAQHAADLKMLANSPELKNAFYNPLNKPKEIVCVRVDGASDEGPSHLEVQFWWTNFHLTHSNYITLISTRSSGSSYLNRVELQNGCLSQAHSNIFIPSTLRGSCTSESGVIDQVKLKQNLEAATDVCVTSVLVETQ